MANPDVTFIHPALAKMMPEYTIINDVIAGSLVVKEKTDDYLPRPNAADITIENRERYNAYVKRAVFYGVTRRTLTGLVGQMFAKEPVIEAPRSMKTLIEDATGEGAGIVQLAKKTANYVVALGRAGLFVDYPRTNGVVTREQVERAGIRPTITCYAPMDIINWRTRKRGTLSVLSLVVLRETVMVEQDEFTASVGTQYRVLALNENGHYFVRVYQLDNNAKYIKVSEVIPHDAYGLPLTEIPFNFIGSVNNDPNIDFAPLFDLADLNVSHYRNSADNEENIFVSAQATLVVSGLTEAWNDKYFAQGVGIGSRGGITLPANGDAKFIQADERSLIAQEMERKERQMVALGAQLVEQKTVQQTATENANTTARETSSLASCANNISVGVEWALGWAAVFTGESETGIRFNINTDFDISKMSPQDRAQTIAEWQGGAITFSEMRDRLRAAGVATLPDRIALEEINAADMLSQEQQPDAEGAEVKEEVVNE